MSENAFVCILFALAIGGCATCSVSEDIRVYQLEKIRLEERVALAKLRGPDPNHK